MPNGHITRRVIVKFHDTVDIPYEDGAERHVMRLGIGPWDQLARRFKGIRLNRLFTVMPAERIGELTKRARERSRRYRPANLLSGPRHGRMVGNSHVDKGLGTGSRQSRPQPLRAHLVTRRCPI